jgi:hypothetical protein
MRTITVVALLGLAALMWTGAATGQQPQPPAPTPPAASPEQPKAAPAPPPPPRDKEDQPLEEKDLRQLIETVKMVRLSQELGLNDEQTVNMVRKFDRYRDQAAQFRRERQQLLRDLKDAAKSGKPEADIDKLIQNLIQQDQKLAGLRTQAFEDAGKDLNPTQRAKLYVFMNDFEDDMRRLIQRARQAGGNGRLMRFREMRDNAMERPDRPDGPEGGPGQPPPPGGFGMRRGPLGGQQPPQGMNPPPPPPGQR